MIDLVFTTTARSDFSLVRSIVEYLTANCSDVSLSLLATGSHFDRGTGYTIEQVRETAGVEIVELDPYPRGDEPEAEVCANILLGLERLQIDADVLVLLGDRYEILPVASYCTVKGVALAHLFGGECDISCCLDTLVRDAVTKMAHLHFVTHEDIKQRLLCMGEEAERIFVIGNPTVSSLDAADIGDEIYQFLSRAGVEADRPLVNACYHPVTTDRTVSVGELRALFDALGDLEDFTFIWSGINSDPGASELKRMIEEYAARKPNHHFFDSLGHASYYSLLKHAAFMIGNSSSGLLEAASFGCPAINVGERQGGRLHGSNVLDVTADAQEIRRAIERVSAGAPAGFTNPFSVPAGMQTLAEVLSHPEAVQNLRHKRLSCEHRLTLERTPSSRDQDA